MSDERAKRLVKAIAVLCEAFGIKPTQDTFAAYEMGTADLPIESVEKAVVAAIVSQKWMPKVFELRELCGAAKIVLSVEDRALVAWNAVRAAISRVGGYSSVQFDDPVTTAVVRVLGGWERFCLTETGPKLDTWLKKEFIDSYRAISAIGVSAEQVRPVAGLIEVSRAASGISVDSQNNALPVPMEVVRTGLPNSGAKPEKRVIHERKSPVAISGPVREFAKSLGLPPADEQPERQSMTKEQAAAELIEFAKRKGLEV